MSRIMVTRSIAIAGLVVFTYGEMAGMVFADDNTEHNGNVTQLLMPMMNASKGRDLFVIKGCVACHSVNGIGGEDAAPLDAHEMDPYMGIFDLAAKMWSMASVMIPAQEDELGGQIQLTGEELGNIVAFLHDDVEQSKLTLDALTEEQREMIDEMMMGD